MDRIAKFAAVLDQRLAELEQNHVKAQFANEEFDDLMEEGLMQASRSLSDERREYLASIIMNSLSSENIQHQESKHLMRILGQLNDLEIIWLHFYWYMDQSTTEREAFESRHPEALALHVATFESSQDVHDKAALGASYKQHLLQLGLIEPQYAFDSKTKQPIYDTFTHTQKINYHRLTPLGRLLMREIGLEEVPE